MKKVFFAFAVVAGLAMTACNNKTESTDAPKVDSAAATTTTTTTTTAPVDTTAKPVDTAAAAKPADAKTETKMEKKEEKKEEKKK